MELKKISDVKEQWFISPLPCVSAMRKLDRRALLVTSHLEGQRLALKQASAPNMCHTDDGGREKADWYECLQQMLCRK